MKQNPVVGSRMTYCLGILTRTGLVMAADSRTNAGVDHISTYQKLFDFTKEGDRVLLLCTSGSLSMTQSVITLLQRDITTETEPNLHTIPTLYEVVRYVGEKVRLVQERDRAALEKDKIDFACSLLLGGQLKGEDPGLYLIYTQGNFIQATPDTPFLQIGETKYGKPIMDRILSYEIPVDSAAKCALLSIDSTMKSNVSVGPPINLKMYQRDTFKVTHELRLRLGAPYLSKMRRMWEYAIRNAFEHLPEIDWVHYLQETPDTIEVMDDVLGDD